MYIRFQEFTDFVEFLFKKCKEHLCLYIHQAAHTVEWTYLSKKSQEEIMEGKTIIMLTLSQTSPCLNVSAVHVF